MRERSGRLRFDRVTLAHRATAAVLIEDLTLSIDPGEVVTVMGPSGSGKSTLLAFAGGFLDRAAFRSTGTLTLGHDRLDNRPAEDRRLRGEIRSFVLAEARARLLPVLLVTHDPADAAAAEGRVLLLERCRTRVVSAEGDMS